MFFDVIAGLSLLISPTPSDALEPLLAGLPKAPQPVRIEVSLPPTTPDGSRVPLIIQVDAQHAEQVLTRLLAQQPTCRPELDRVLQKLEKLEKQLDSLHDKLAFLPRLAGEPEFQADSDPFDFEGSITGRRGHFVGDIGVTGPRPIPADWTERLLHGSSAPPSLFEGDAERQARRQAVEQLLQTLVELNRQPFRHPGRWGDYFSYGPEPEEQAFEWCPTLRH